MNTKIHITPEIAARMYEIAVKFCEARPEWSDTFVRYATGGPHGEYRFGGMLGGGGKLRFDPFRWWIDFYPEDETPSRVFAATHANAALAILREECHE